MTLENSDSYKNDDKSWIYSLYQGKEARGVRPALFSVPRELTWADQGCSGGLVSIGSGEG